MMAAKSDIQALVLRGLAHLPQARYRAFTIGDPRRAAASVRTWAVAGSGFVPAPDAVTVGFTDAGLAALGVSAQARSGLSPAFREGMQAPHRARRLGDLRDSSTGSPGIWGQGVHVWAAHLRSVVGSAELRTDGLVEVASADSVDLGGREHFGFRDGIGQPRVGEAEGELPLGEFVLGHPDGSGGPSADPSDALLKNGSYAVVRQLEQDVEAFWKMVQEAAAQANLSALDLASQFVGRRPDGRPLGPVGKAGDLDFRNDPHGEGCPLGSHVRRSNPRDGGVGAAAVLKAATDRHRIVRRGRPYGAPAEPGAYPGDLGVFPTAPGPGPRGLMFVCFQADIERQFEFVQQAWIRNPHFSGGANQPDPLLGDGGEFLARGPKGPVRVALGAPKVVLRGGVYVFVPGLTALARILGRSLGP